MGDSTHLLIGPPGDPACMRAAAALQARGHTCTWLADPFAASTGFSWSLDSDRTTTRLVTADGRILGTDSIASVLVRTIGTIDPTGWTGNDAAYAQAEASAALLGWLWSLRCPVVGRLPAWLWYRPQPRLAFWQMALRRAAVPSTPLRMTNVAVEMPRFDADTDRLVHTPLTIRPFFIAGTPEVWRGLAAAQAHYPLCLTPQPDVVTAVCIVGEQVIVDADEPIPVIADSLVDFACDNGLDVVSIGVDTGPDGPRVYSVDPGVDLERFEPETQDRIVEGMVDLMTGARAPFAARAGAAP
jgi:hypothetical protein